MSAASDPLGQVEFAALDAVSKGVLRSRRIAAQVGEATLHEVLRRCEREGLLRSRRDSSGRRYELTAAGRVKLRRDRRFRRTFVRLLARSG